jgi:hypothetical protein
MDATTLAEPVQGEVVTTEPKGQALSESRPAPEPAVVDDPFLAMIERAARDPAISVEKLERLFDLSERARAVRAKQAFAEAFAALQIELPTIDRKNRIVVYSKEARERKGGPVEGVDVPQQSTPYATLETIIAAIRAPLSKHGFGIRFEHATANGLIETTAILTHREGHAERANVPPLQHDSSGSKNNVQAVGSSLTYGRRYALLALLAIVSHAPQDADDDGKAAGEASPHAGITDEQVAELRALIVQASVPEKIERYTGVMLKRYKVARMEDLTPAQFDGACKVIRGQIAEQASAGDKAAP